MAEASGEAVLWHMLLPVPAKAKSCKRDPILAPATCPLKQPTRSSILQCVLEAFPHLASPVQALTGAPGLLPLDQKPKTLSSPWERSTTEMWFILWGGSNEPSVRLFSFSGPPGAGIANLCQN